MTGTNNSRADIGFIVGAGVGIIVAGGLALAFRDVRLAAVLFAIALVLVVMHEPRKTARRTSGGGGGGRGGPLVKLGPGGDYTRRID